MSIAAIILARGGSKRIPDKNIRQFRGRPLLAWPIEAALSWGEFDSVVISTDSMKIADIACSLGAKNLGLRSEVGASDNATTAEGILETIEMIKYSGANPKYICCIYGSAAFVTPAMLRSCYKKIIEENFDTVFPVLNFSYPIWRAMQRDESGATNFIWPENALARSQDIRPAFHDAGQFYIVKTEMLIKTRSLLGGKTGSIEIAETDCHDIDTLIDWEIAEIKHSRLHSKMMDSTD